MLHTDLLTAPFSLREALDAGLSPRDLERKAWVRLASRIYRWRYLTEDPWDLLATWHRMLPSDAVFAGPTACWMHGLDLDPIRPVHVIVPSGSQRSRFGLAVRRCKVGLADVATIRGMRVTGLHRTLRDICLRFEPREALVALDMALAAQKTDRDAMVRHSYFARGQQGVKRLRWLIDRAAPAQSPMETRLRWILLEAKLPVPEVQADLFDARGRFIGRADLYYPDHRLVLEYDGGNHRDRLVSDDRRQNLILDAGFRLLRFTAPDIYRRPAAVVALVRNGLGRKSAISRPAVEGFGGKTGDLAALGWAGAL